MHRKSNTQAPNASPTRDSRDKPKSQGNSNKPRQAKKSNVSTIPVSQFIKPISEAVKTGQDAWVPTQTFADLGFDASILELVEKAQYTSPREIQEKAIPHIFEGKNVIGLASTGTGKTAAFLLPIIQDLIYNPEEFNTLILVPTRELATQIDSEFLKLTQGLKLFSTVLIGGTSVNKSIAALRRTNHVVVGTPGRVWDMYAHRVLPLKEFRTFILDEFDRMLDMGFVKDMEKIRSQMKGIDQTLLFSATYDKKQESIIQEFAPKATIVSCLPKIESSKQVNQDIVRVATDSNKFDTLVNILKDYEKVIIFSETKRGATRLCEKLQAVNIPTADMHGNISQAKREKALGQLRSGHIRVLVATDVAARGIDIPDVDLVINYEAPRSYDDYIHRIGRTGRSGKLGKALTFVDSNNNLDK